MTAGPISPQSRCEHQKRTYCPRILTQSRRNFRPVDRLAVDAGGFGMLPLFTRGIVFKFSTPTATNAETCPMSKSDHEQSTEPLKRDLDAVIFQENGLFRFDIVDLRDTLNVGKEVLPELLFSDRILDLDGALKTVPGATREGTAERNAALALEQFLSADPSLRRLFCGYDSIRQCKLPRPKRSGRALKRAG